MATRTNQVTLFSNGVGHFNRFFKVGNDSQRISIPFKRNHIGVVAASLQVFGQVKYSAPPSFTPSNANDTSLVIEQSQALKSLLRSLSGAQVAVTSVNKTTKNCTLLGLDTQVTFVDNKRVEKDFIVLMIDGQVKQFEMSEIDGVEFLEESVKTEIQKALKNNFQEIKPDSTSLDLSLIALKEECEASVQYTIPVAAWKMRYTIREDKGVFTLEGAAIVDNNTDEDWDNFIVSVVTGNPISFDTDIANICEPRRKMVPLVDTESLGNVEVEDGVAEACCATRSVRSRKSLRSAGLECASFTPNYTTENYSNSAYPPDDAESLQQLAAGDGYMNVYYGSAAEAPGVDSKEVGDFCIFSCKEPITILARKSAIVPMFSVPLTKAAVVLLYQESSHARRPFRAIKFKNETEYSLGKGKTLIYNEGIFSGEDVLQPTKPGENRMLTHCLENGVKIVKDVRGVESIRSSIRVSEGIAFDETVQTGVTHYTIENKKDEAFKLAIEHRNLIGQANATIDFEGVEIKEKEKLVTQSGHRVYFDLAPNQKVTLVVTETYAHVNQVAIGGSYHWIHNILSNEKIGLDHDKQFAACMKIQSQIDEVARELQQLRTTQAELKEQAKRVQENLNVVKNAGSNVQVAEWVNDLTETEKEIRSIERTKIPALNKKSSELQSQMTKELKKVSVSWKLTKAAK